jgi:hypothetical protein
MTPRIRRLALGIGLLVGPAPLGAGAADGPAYWPSEREEQLRQADARVLDVQRQLFNARMSGDQAAVERLSPEMKRVSAERQEILRATQQRQ